MDFNKILIPYSENGRTPEGQQVWLEKKGIPKDIIEHVMIEVYREVESGVRKFDNGVAFDHHLLKLAEQYVQESRESNTRSLETRAAVLQNKFKVQASKLKKIWMVIKGEL